ncbi:unnamed protein product [Onchocerca ochengi]|uniref:DUF1758 domain-containing protein n=1 Tax=Onchocerca ochengi TaxID=42157 RepID=A0A182EXX1_ONCOC|nr:unnamed protein product [Onchocerca ochengi]
MIKTDCKKLPVMVKQEQLDSRDGYCKKLDILIGDNYFLDLIQFESIIAMESGYSMVLTKLGPTIIGTGYINQPYKHNKGSIYSKITTLPTKTAPLILNEGDAPDVDNFWKLELLGKHEQPHYDDDRSLELFKKTLTKVGRRNQVSWPWKELKLWKETKPKINTNYVSVT